MGEHHVLDVATDALVDACLAWVGEDREKRRQILTVLNRATRAEHGSKAKRAEAQLTRLMQTQISVLGGDLVKVALETPGRLLDLCADLEAQVNSLDESVLAAIDDELPPRSLALMDLSLSIAIRRAELARNVSAAIAAPRSGWLRALFNKIGGWFAFNVRAERLGHLASRVDKVGMRLSDLGWREEALAASQEAFDIYRRLAQTRPDAFLPDLAISLNNLGIRLSSLGRREDALATSQQAVDIYRRLAQTRPDVFLPDVAMSLNNVGAMLFSLGRREDALAASQEAVDIYRRLAQTRPDVFLPDVAMSLNNAGAMLSHLGRREKALAASQDAVDIYRHLARTRPDAFLPDLAKSLGALSVSLVAAERHADAAAVTREGLKTIMPFVELHPKAFGELARALGRDHLATCEKAGTKADVELLGRLALAAESEEEHPALAAMKLKIGAILEAAEKTGALDEAALGELPAELAEQLRTTWANRTD
jgi:tetratricopeptide (TPR) repeat protein